MAVVAIDGPSGSGKSSTSRGVARALGLNYLDTGAMYRAMAWYMLERGVDVSDPQEVAAGLAGDPALESGVDPDAPTISVDGVDVSGPIRESGVTAAVSPVAAVGEVRARLVEIQRAAVGQSIAAGRGIVVEGRDIGTVVLPDATAKAFLTADAEARAARRALEDAQRGGGAGGGDVAATAESLAARDKIDSTRAVAPLRRADGAIQVDGTFLTLAEVIDVIVGIVRDACAAQE
jgi:CMP/dCMP kinase